jgi:type IV pilus assembly protein PilW
MNQQSQIFTGFDGNHVPSRPCPEGRQRGLTMIELLVAMVISLLIVLAAAAALTVTKRGFSTVDTSSQLRDNIRFTTDLMQRLGVQTGYRDIVYAATPPPPAVSGVAADPPPNVFGFNNAWSDTSDPENTATTRTAGVDGFGSDVLILRYQTLETFPGSNVADGSMIDCAGASPGGVPLNRYARMTSIIHVAISQGEPTLMCTSFTAGGAPNSAQPIIRGVENFQVLYGVQGVTAGVAPPAAASSDPVAAESAPDRYLRADELTVAGNVAGTNANWRNVRSIRIGLVVRGALNSTQDLVSQTFYPFGPAKSSSVGAIGSAMSNTAALDPGTVFIPTVDGRLRQTATFTVHLRNDQGL